MILVMGLQKTGQSITDYLTKKDRPYCVYDKKEEVLLRYEVLGIKTYKDDEPITDRSIDLVVKSPGIPPYEPHIKYFKSKGIRVISDVEFFYMEFKSKNIIAITGTNGKTTTTEMVYELLKKREPVLAGNIGMTIFSNDMDRDRDDIYVFELSSFQLENTDTFRPRVAVLLNIEEDHLDWHGSFENYKKSKYKIFKNQRPGDALIISADHINESEIRTDADIYRLSLDKKEGMNAYLDGDDVVFDINDFKKRVPISKLRYKEKHNIINFMAAVLAASFYELTDEMLDDFLGTFRLDYHRVEFVDEVSGVTFIDDSKATNPSATVSAIMSTPENTTLLLGGFDKKTDFTDLIKLGGEKVKSMIFFGDINGKLKETADKLEVMNYFMADKLIDAFTKAVEISEPGDTVLLSPGASSFDEFKGYEERGDYFKELVRELKDGTIKRI